MGAQFPARCHEWASEGEHDCVAANISIEPDLAMIEASISFMLRPSHSADPSTQTGRGLGKSFLEQGRQRLAEGHPSIRDNFREGVPRRFIEIGAPAQLRFLRALNRNPLDYPPEDTLQRRRIDHVQNDPAANICSMTPRSGLSMSQKAGAPGRPQPSRLCRAGTALGIPTLKWDSLE